MRRRFHAGAIALWATFLVVHAVVAWWGWVLPNQPMGDIVLVYQPWSQQAAAGGAIVGVTETWVYPQLALVPMLVAYVLALPMVGLLGPFGAYLVAWAVLVAVLDAIGLAMLVGRGRTRPRRIAGWFWCAALLLLGPVAMYRIDAITVPLAVIGGLWVSTRPALAAALLTAGAWIKIWPGALLLAAIAAGRSRLRMLIAAASVTAAIVAVLFLLGADDELFGFVAEQTGRGLQIEAVAATPFLWMAAAGSASIEYSSELLTFQFGSPAAEAVSSALTPLMALVVLGLIVIGALKVRGGAQLPRLLPPLALALVVALIVTNKVGSPQFQVWLFAPVILWIALDRIRADVPALLALGLAGLTLLVYPLTYDGLLRAELLPVVLLSARNIVLVVLFAHAVRVLLRVPARDPH